MFKKKKITESNLSEIIKSGHTKIANDVLNRLEKKYEFGPELIVVGLYILANAAFSLIEASKAVDSEFSKKLARELVFITTKAEVDLFGDENNE